MDSPSRVYVPSVLEADGNAIGMGCFSTEKIAWEVMKTFLGKSEQMNLNKQPSSLGMLMWLVRKQ